MKHREPTAKDIKNFERIAAEPKTAEVMEKLGQQLCMNFEHPARVFLEIAANQLGLSYDLIDAFHEWFRLDRVSSTSQHPDTASGQTCRMARSSYGYSSGR